VGYLVQKTKLSSLSIGGQDYTSSMVSWAATDASAYKRGLITTTGRVVLGQRPGGVDIENYDRDVFKRGTPVILEITDGNGSTYRHPRGLLYVVTVSYDVEQEELEVELGCRLALAYLSDDFSSVLPLVPIYLDEAQRTIQNCSASFASAGMYLYQDNQGDLIEGYFFESDISSVAMGDWVSVLGVTSLSVSPLSGSDPIPDEIELSYQVPIDALTSDETGKIDILTEVSNYFISYPAATYTRVEAPGGFEGIVDGGGTTTPPAGGSSSSTCGNVPSPPTTAPPPIDPENQTPDGQPPNACNSGWRTEASPTFVGAVKTNTSTTTYNGPGAQVSSIVQETYGPALEVNSQYYADKFAYCTALYGFACNPNGNCPMEGLDQTLQRRVVEEMEFGEANEVVRTVSTEYVPVMTFAQPFDWRSGTIDGFPQDFDDSLDPSTMVRARQIETVYSQANNSNVQTVTTYESIGIRGGGIKTGSGSLDALKGIKTSSRRTSTTITALPVRPDTANTVTTSTDRESTLITLGPKTFVTPPSESGPYTLEEAIPVPVLLTKEEEESGSQVPDLDAIEEVVTNYSYYLTRFIKGDLYGLRVAEALRPEIASNWRPGMPFAYVDDANAKIIAARMNACSWGVTADESLVVTDAVWTGNITGATVDLGDNLTGNSRPDMTRPTPENPNPNPTPPQPPADAPSLDGGVVGRSYYTEVDVSLMLDSNVFFYGENGVVAEPLPPQDVNVNQTLIVFVNGLVVEPGGVLETAGDGSIPLEYAGNLLTEDAVIVINDLFPSGG